MHRQFVRECALNPLGMHGIYGDQESTMVSFLDHVMYTISDTKLSFPSGLLYGVRGKVVLAAEATLDIHNCHGAAETSVSYEVYMDVERGLLTPLKLPLRRLV